MAETTYQLRIQKGPEPGTVYPLTSVSITIGRDPMADITINDPEVSRQHARLTHVSTSYELLDLGSTNGTFIDGERLSGEAVTLQDGQNVEMGSGVSMVFQIVRDVPDLLPTMLDTPAAYGVVEEEPAVIIEPIEDDAVFEPLEESFAIDEPQVEIRPETAVADSEPAPVDDAHTILDFNEPDWPETPPDFANQPGEDVDPVSDWENKTQDVVDDITDEAELPAAAAIIESYKDEPDYVDSASEPPQAQQIIDQPPEKKSNNQRIIAIVVGIFLLLCCCCLALTVLLWYGGDVILRELQIMP